MSKIPTCKEILSKFEKVYDFNQQIGLYDTVHVNEAFFIGNQWEGVEANGLPTPTFNMLKQVVNFQVSTITSDNFVLQASPMPGIGTLPPRKMEYITKIINNQFAAIIERNRITAKMRTFLRNAAVDGDGCMYFYFDPTIENGQKVKGEIVAEITENTRVGFGNPNCREVQKQPWITICRREMVEDVRYKVEKNRKEGITDIASPDAIQPDSEKFQNRYDSYTDDKVTVIMYFYRNRETNTIWYAEATEAGFLIQPYDTGYQLYPLVWLNWDYIQDCYHGQAMITGLIPNQKFINKMFALVGISLTTQSFPKTIYDRTKIRAWDGGVGTAVGVNGNVDGVAKTIEGAAVNPQIAQFMELCIDKTRSFLGASDVAMGDSRPDNTSAIIALQRAANTPMEMTKQNMYQCIEDMGRIFMDIMSVRYGIRKVAVKMEAEKNVPIPLDIQLPEDPFAEDFDFSILRTLSVSIRQDAGASSYWSEIACMQTLDNLLINKQITLLQYLERLPNGYITEKQKLIDDIKAAAGMPTGAPGAGTGTAKPNTDINSLPIPNGQGNGELQRTLNAEGV